MEKNLKNKAIDIKGKQYVLVSDRVIYFNEQYPNGCIKTNIVKYEDGQVTIRARVYPDMENINRYFSGYAQEIEGTTFINKTSALENAETSAVGRALAMMGIGVIDSIASVDEINKATNRPEAKKSLSPADITQEIYEKLPEAQQIKVRDYYANKVELPFINEEELYIHKNWIK
jgi:hypothetical protein